MPEHQQDSEETVPEQAAGYEAPVVEDLDDVDGPAVTAAGSSQAG